MSGALVILSIFISIHILRYWGEKDKLHRYYTSACPPPEVLPNEIIMKGEHLELGDDDLDRILKKRFTYYSFLEEDLKQRFLKRLKVFMSAKTFIIKDDEGVREMPVLVSAAAIGLTLGLKDFSLPFYNYIRIYPEEYIAHDSLRVLAGNVHHNIITVAWNHLLKGYNDFADGCNVGLHEMSHALYTQKIVIEKGYANKFLKRYNYLVHECHKAYNMEAEGKKDLYSDYANNNLQEFWAESVELFFEKPLELKNHYPDVYKALSLLLNQDTTQKTAPVLKSRTPLSKKLPTIVNLLRVKAIGKKQL